MTSNEFIPSLMLMTLSVGFIIGIWQLLAFLQRRGDRQATERQLIGTGAPTSHGVTAGALPDLAAIGGIALIAMALLVVGYKTQTMASQSPTHVGGDVRGDAADSTPPRLRASPAEKSNAPTSPSSPAQPGSSPTNETGVSTTVDRPAAPRN